MVLIKVQTNKTKKFGGLSVRTRISKVNQVKNSVRLDKLKFLQN